LEPDAAGSFRIKIKTYHIGLFASFLDKLRKTPDGNGNLLDHSMILYGSGMSNGNVHSHDILPALIAGGATSRLSGNLHVKAPLMTPLSNLLVSILDKAGVKTDRLGDSYGCPDPPFDGVRVGNERGEE
jgi:hypothetical protein